MSAYTNQTAIEGNIAPPDLIAALDDVGTGTLNVSQLNTIINNVSTDIDGYLASVYPVPFSPGAVPPAVANAALAMASEAVYARRLSPGETNLWSESAKLWRDTMLDIGKGIGNLGPNFPKAVPPGIASIQWMDMDMTTA